MNSLFEYAFFLHFDNSIAFFKCFSTASIIRKLGTKRKSKGYCLSQ